MIVTFHSIQLLLMSLICVQKEHFWKLKKLSVPVGYVSDNSTYSFLNFYVQKWSIVAPIRIRTACYADLEQVHLSDSDQLEIFSVGSSGRVLHARKILCCFVWRVARYRHVSADIEGEIDSDLDSGSTTFCCVPRFVAHWYSLQLALFQVVGVGVELKNGVKF